MFAVSKDLQYKGQVRLLGQQQKTHRSIVETQFELLTCAGVSLWGACAVKAQRAGSHAHPDLLHPNPLQVHEEARLAGQAAIVVGAGQAATLLTPRAHTRDLCGHEQGGGEILMTQEN